MISFNVWTKTRKGMQHRVIIKYSSRKIIKESSQFLKRTSNTCSRDMIKIRLGR
jgi:hypothetical protein